METPHIFRDLICRPLRFGALDDIDCAFLYKLELEYIPGYTGVVLLCAVILVFTTGISHSPSRGFIMHYITMVLFFIATMLLLFNTTQQLSSRNYPIDIRDALCRPGKTIAVCAFDDNCFEILSCPCFVELIVWLFGSNTAGPAQSCIL